MSTTKISFGRIFWPSFVAVIVATIIGLILFTLTVFGIIGSFSAETPGPSVKNNSVLHIQLDGVVAEKGNAEFDPGTFQMSNQLGLSDILYALDEAKKDKKIKGVFLELKGLSCGMATARELRNAINRFEESGKFVVAYNAGEVIGLRKYYISSAANQVYGFPTSTMEFLGLGVELAYFKNTLEMLDVEMQVIRGSNNDFKSAVEPFFLDKMSDSSRVQVERYLTSMWDDMLKDIAKDRKLSVSNLNNLAQNATVARADDGAKHKLLDGTKYRDEVMEIVRKKSGAKTASDMNLVDFEKYAKKKFYQSQKLAKSNKPNVAVILAEGGVAVEGDGLTSQEICKLFKKARENKSIQTVVFRINSPGGSALASEEIWREVELTNKTKKVIVSMGDVAASGGYYIASPASYIFAEPMTITGSIGVFGVIPYTGKMLENKLGLTFDRAMTNQHAVMTTNRKLTEVELARVQGEVDDIYAQFLKRVATGRKMSTEQVNVIARGRVWTGRDAKRIGLVDELGGLNDAINYAVKKAGIKEAKVLYYPLVKEDKFAAFLAQLEDESDDEAEALVKVKQTAQMPEELMKYYAKLRDLEKIQGVQMRMPFMIDWMSK